MDLSDRYRVIDTYLKEKIPALAGIKVANPMQGHGKTYSTDESRSNSLSTFAKISECIGKAYELICASPSRKLMFEKGYAFPSEADKTLSITELTTIRDCNRNIEYFDNALSDGNAVDLIINANHHCVRRFVDRLCVISKNERDDSGKRYIKSLFLRGAYGEGKTSFINYIFSVHQDVFDTAGVINIKIDLTDQHDMNDAEIELVIAMKTIRILKRFYFKPGGWYNVDKFIEYAKSLGCDDQELQKFKNYITSKGVCLNAELAIKLNEMLTLFAKNDTYRPAGFVFVIDGLDNYYRNHASKIVFLNRAQQVLSYISAHDDMDCYLIVVRNESYDYVLTKRKGYRPPQFTSYRLCTVSSEIIHAKKIELLEHLIRNSIEHCVKCKDDREYCINCDPPKFFCELRLTSKFSNVLFAWIRKYFIFGAIEEIPGANRYIADKNNRYWCEAFCVVVNDFLKFLEVLHDCNMLDNVKLLPGDDFFKSILNKILSQQIKLSGPRYYTPLRPLMLNGFYYHRERFSIVRNKLPDDMPATEDFVRVSASFFERSSFLTNLYLLENYELFSQDMHAKQPASTIPFLVKIRALQLFKYYKFSKRISATINDVSAELCDYFSYPSAQIKVYIASLYSNLCLQRTHTAPFDNFDDYSCGMSITGHGLYILDSLLFEFGYYENVIDNTILPLDSVVNYFTPIITYGGLYDCRSKDAFLSVYKDAVSIKIFRALFFVRWIIHVESCEVALFNNKYPGRKFSFDPDDNEDSLLISPMLEKMSTSAIDAIHRDTDPAVWSNFLAYADSQQDLLKHH